MSGGFFPHGSPRITHHPLASIFPMLNDVELDALGDDMKSTGQVETIKLHKGMLLDGRNREEAAFRKQLGIRYETFTGTDRDALNWVISKNLKRRHLTESQRAMVAARLANFRLGDNQHSKPASIEAPSLPGVEAEAESAPIAQSDAAELLNVSRSGVQRAAVVMEKGSPELQSAVEQGKIAVSVAAELTDLPKDEQKAIAALSEKEILEAASKIRKEKNDKRRTERVEKIKAISAGSGPLALDRKFPVIYMDPPTKFAAGDSDRSTENHYPTMDEEEIAKLPIGELATADAVLFIWTTVPWLRKTIRLIEGWGFDYVSEVVWDKVHISTGFWNRNQHESLLIATRGKMPAPERSLLKPSVHTEARAAHSAKPAFFRGMIGCYYPDLPKVELFARVDGAMPDGWHAWGNQARVPQQQSLLPEAAE